MMTQGKKTCCLLLVALVLFAAGCGGKSEKILLTIGDRSIYESEAHYFLISSAQVMRTDLPYIGWDDVIDGTPVNEYIKNEAADAMRRHHAVRLKAEELSAWLTEEQQSELDAMWNDRIAYYGNEKKYLEYLKSVGLTGELFRYMVDTMVIYQNVREALSGISDEEFEKLTNEWMREITYSTSDEWDKIYVKELYESYRQAS